MGKLLDSQFLLRTLLAFAKDNKFQILESIGTGSWHTDALVDGLFKFYDPCFLPVTSQVPVLFQDMGS